MPARVLMDNMKVSGNFVPVQLYHLGTCLLLFQHLPWTLLFSHQLVAAKSTRFVLLFSACY
jgi:hypothetical protein